ncbi:sel1 repeat family protein [Aggregicoccus sp. 17bor-14]|uniref:tetratricopeptide repeat protein n=1 Tax=Myxococcaceae TaxID=31 RepID=UPI00129C6D3C|nr:MULTISPECIES: tetratricopeptide repeat protein [Myxococcaceae]MBF5043618.1 sel1 repeat family protein [Simulacricoccus sp. 17bor-14]MRI89377.1 sel1 repeat family protein [Aggregicoccus sp. 17bor-14]
MPVALLVALAVLSPSPDARPAPEGLLPPTRRATALLAGTPVTEERAVRPLWKGLEGERGLRAYRLVRECESRSPSPCAVMAGKYVRGAGVAKDEWIAAALLESACKVKENEGRDYKACSALGILLATGAGGLPRDLTWALELQRWACSSSETIGCAALGDLLLPAQPEPTKDAEVVALYRRGCDADYSAACNNLGWMLERGRGAARDLAQARALYERSCKAKLAVGCKNLGVVYAASTRPEELAEAARYLEPFCSAAEPATCSVLGSVEERRGERQRALAAYGRGCSAGHLRSCNNQGFLLGLSHTPEDEARALSLFERACDAGVGLACANAATLVAPDRARTFNARACALGVQGICEPQ